MSVVLIGGMDRLEREYITNAKQLGINLKVFTTFQNSLNKKIGRPDYVIILTNRISHKAKREAIQAVQKNNIAFYQHHTCSISSINKILIQLKNQRQ